MTNRDRLRHHSPPRIPFCLAGALLAAPFATQVWAGVPCGPFFDQASNTVVPALTSDYGDSVSRAENFVLTETTDICGFTARGAWSIEPPVGGAATAPFTVIFHQDAGGVPGLPLVTNTALISTSQAPTGPLVETTGGNFRPERAFVFDLGTPVTLSTGTYWIELFQNQGTDIFLWSQSSTPDGAHGASTRAVGIGAPGASWSSQAGELSLQIRGEASVAGCSTVALGINEEFSNDPALLAPYETGWLVTATQDMDLQRVETRFSSGADGRTINILVWNGNPIGPPAATATMSPINNVFAGGNLNTSVSFVNGQTYFIGFQNVANLGSNSTLNPGADSFPNATGTIAPPPFETAAGSSAPVLNLIGCAAVPPGDPCADGVNVLLVAADTGTVGPDTGHVGDVHTKLLATLPLGSTVDFFDARNDSNAGTTKVPSLATLQNYDVAFVWSFDTYDDRVALGNVLADYYDDGGGVVVANNDFGSGAFSLAGRWASGGYQAIPRTGSAASASSLTIGTVYHPTHPLLNGVATFNGGTSSRRPSATTVLPGAIKIAGWSNAASPADHDLLATKIGAPASIARPIVDLGFIPFSNDVDATGWSDGGSGLPDTDGEIIMANAILHAVGCTPFIPPPGSISDLVFNDLDADGIQDGGELGIDGVTVNLLDNALGFITSTVTSGGGLYSFGGLTPGDYHVEFDDSTFPANLFVTLPNQGGDDALDSDVPQDGTNLVGPINITFGEDENTIDLGLAAGATIGDFVWEDVDGDGIQDLGEPGIDGVTVELVDNTNTVVDTDVTSGGGAYSFSDVAPGDYTVRVTPLDGTWYFTRANEGGDDTLDSDILDEYLSVVGETAAFSVNVGDNEDTIDAGMFQQGSISDFVWLDIDDDGIQDGGEPGLDGVNVDLVNTTLGVNTTTATAAGGAYSFGSLFPHDGYVLSFHLPAPGVPEVSLFSPADQGGDDTVDSDASVVVDLDTQSTSSVAVVSNTENDTVDCGMRDVTDPTATLVCDPFGVFYSCTINETETFTVTFDEPVNLDVAANILVTNASVSNIQPVGPAPSDTWTFDVTAAAEGTITVQVGVGAFADPATNDNTATLVCTYVYDITAPVEDCGGELTNLTPSITNDLVLVFLVTFDEDVHNVDASDFSGNAAALITNIDPTPGPGSTYTITVTVAGPGIYTLSWEDPSADWIEDCAGNDFAGSESFGQVEVIDDSVALTGTLQYDEIGGFNGDQFGWSVGQSGPVTFVGTPADDDSGLSSGSVHVAEQDNAGSHPLTQKLVASDALEGDRFGEAVSVDGDWGIVGAAYDDIGALGAAGSAYFFARDEVSGTWGDGLGGSLEYQKVEPSVSGPNWVHGRAVSLQGRTAIVGVPQGAATGVTALFRSGRAVIYEFDSCTELWTESEQLVAFDAAGYDGYGASVAVFGSIALVGAPSDDDLGSATGAVYAYRRSGPGTWIFDAKIVPASGGQGDNIGTSVAMFGDIAVIGAPGDDDQATNAGAVYVFERVGPGVWNQLAKVVSSDGAIADAFGSSVAFDGVTLVGGAPLHNGTGTDSGALYSFTSAGWTETHKFLTSLTKKNNKLGTSVAVDGRRCVGGAPYGETRVMGAPVFNSGNVSFYELP